MELVQYRVTLLDAIACDQRLRGLAICVGMYDYSIQLSC